MAAPDAELILVERPLRAQTAQGERVAIARSMAVPAGTVLQFEVHCYENVITHKCLEMLFSYGEMEGLGQWRGSSAGSFRIVELAVV